MIMTGGKWPVLRIISRRSMRHCDVSGCDRPYHLKGYCLAHYKRLRKYGEPLGGSTAWGAVQRFMCEVIESQTDECISFPYSKDQYGYGKLRIDGGNIGAHVYALTQTAGPKPTPKHEACHSCGNGKAGCVNPRHLYWGTRSDNVRDAIKTGTAYKFPVAYGESHPQAKFTDQQIMEIRRMLASGARQMDVAAAFGISQSHVSRIKNGSRSTVALI
jgi:hypothetical protein